MKKALIIFALIILILTGCAKTQPEKESGVISLGNPANSEVPSQTPVPSQQSLEQTPPPAQSNVQPESPSAKTNVQELTLEADDKGFYPENKITVEKDKTARVTFRVRTSNVYYGGLQIKGTLFNTGDIRPGSSKTVEFVATSDSTFASYWPSSGVKKADGRIVVG